MNRECCLDALREGAPIITALGLQYKAAFETQFSDVFLSSPIGDVSKPSLDGQINSHIFIGLQGSFIQANISH